MKETKKTQANEIAQQNIFSFAEYFRGLDSRFGDLNIADKMIAITKAGSSFNSYIPDPLIQNRRVKGVSSLPVNIGKDKIAECLQKPNESETPLRQVSNVLEYTAYPYFKLRKTYQDILTYRYYSYPCYLDKGDAKKPEFMREWQLVDKLNNTLRPDIAAHEIAGQCIRDGKAFYVLRSNIDKAHNSVNYCFLQQLPQDWVKIIGNNNVSKYTVAFNMMYFAQPGATWTQFGDTFADYIDGFSDVLISDKKVVYSAKKPAIDIEKFTRMRDNAVLAGDPDVYCQNGVWNYWVTLPAGKIWVFEADDVSRNVISPLIGLALSMAQISQYESVQLELVQNPLVACVLGEMEYRDDAAYAAEDAYKLSPSGRAFFESLWYQMLAQNNTSGIGIYSAPLKNMHLEQLSEAPSASEISSKGYSYAMLKSGSGILPMDAEPRAGSVNISAMIEAQFAKLVYGQFERMMNYLYSVLNMRYTWRFKMFGDIFSDKDTADSCRQGLTLGLMSETLKYNAVMGQSTLDDISISNMLVDADIMGVRIPLQTSYTSTGEEKNTNPTDKGGRPEADPMDPGTESQEQSQDAGY